MRALLSLLCIVVLLSLAQPAQAQLRENAQVQQAPTQLYASDTGFNLFSDLFDAEHFRMGHSYEMSFSSFGGNSSSLGMYTNTMMWQFNDELAARVDVSVAHSLMGGASFQEQQPRVFLRNAEIAYRPAKNIEFHFQMRQSPYGRFMSPYGYGYGGFSPYRSSFGIHSLPTHDLFWRNDSPR